MKAEEKQVHDDREINKKFTSECSKTGGGPSPNLPTGDKEIKNIDTNSSFLIEIDGDTIETDTNIDFLDPTETPRNQLSTADNEG